MCLGEELINTKVRKENGSFVEGGAHDYSSKKTKEVLPGIEAQLLFRSLGCVTIQFLEFCLLTLRFLWWVEMALVLCLEYSVNIQGLGWNVEARTQQRWA